MSPAASWKRSHWRDMQYILRHEGNQKDGVQCCPSVLEMVTKKGGRTPTGHYVELYEDGENQQRLFEISCAANVVDQPCRFVDARLYNESRCIQKYSYSYALVRYLHTPATETPQPRSEGHFSVPGSGGWSMDYVRVRAGCECQIKPNKSNLTNQTNPPVEDTSSERGTGESPQTTKPDCRSVLVKSIRDIEQIWDHPVILRLQIYLFWCFRLVRVKYLNVSEVVFVCVRILWIVFRYLHQVTSLVGAALGRSINVFILFFVCITLLVVVRLVILDLSKLKCLLCALDNNSILSENYWNFQYNVICIH